MLRTPIYLSIVFCLLSIIPCRPGLCHTRGPVQPQLAGDWHIHANQSDGILTLRVDRGGIIHGAMFGEEVEGAYDEKTHTLTLHRISTETGLHTVAQVFTGTYSSDDDHHPTAFRLEGTFVALLKGRGQLGQTYSWTATHSSDLIPLARDVVFPDRRRAEVSLVPEATLSDTLPGMDVERAVRIPGEGWIVYYFNPHSGELLVFLTDQRMNTILWKAVFPPMVNRRSTLAKQVWNWEAFVEDGDVVLVNIPSPGMKSRRDEQRLNRATGRRFTPSSRRPALIPLVAHH